MTDKKVAIATWAGNTTLNYGSLLQAVAMQKLINQCGYHPVTINYCPQKERSRAKCSKKRRELLFTKGSMYLKTYRSFSKYVKKNLKLSTVCYDFQDIIDYVKKSCTILLSGSDAVWWEGWMNSNWIAPLFLWNFPELSDYGKISYAPSLLMGGVGEALQNCLESYDAISVREKASYEKIKNYTDKEVSVVLDPVLTVSEDFWKKQAAKRLIEEDYVLAYFCSEAALHRISVQEVQEKYHAKRVVYINMNFVDKAWGLTDYGDEEFPGIVGPSEFLSLVKYAKAVCTDSFHGMLTSIVFRRDFFVFDRNSDWQISKDYRFQDVIERLCLGNRIVRNNKDIDKISKIDYKNAEKYLFTEREKSLDFLVSSLNKQGEKNGCSY